MLELSLGPAMGWGQGPKRRGHLCTLDTCLVGSAGCMFVKIFRVNMVLCSLFTRKVQSTLVISNFTGPDKNVRVISSSRQPNCDVIGMTTVGQNVLERHMYMVI